MRRLVCFLVVVSLLFTPATVSNQTTSEDFTPWIAKDAPVPLQWYCLDPAPHPYVYRTEFCSDRWVKGKCESGVHSVYYDPESPARVCGWFMLFSTMVPK